MADAMIVSTPVLNSSVTPFQRLSNVLFGCPSIRRANGGFKTHFFNWKLNVDFNKGFHKGFNKNVNTGSNRGFIGTFGSEKQKSCGGSRGKMNDPVRKSFINNIFSIDEQSDGKDEKLPKIWITEKAVCLNRDTDDKDAEIQKREFIAAYPNGDDVGGVKALELAERMLGEGFGASDISVDECRCFFQAAEILLLHSVDRGNMDAALKLGDIYRYDLCKGLYWLSKVERRAMHAKSLDRGALQRRAWIMYSLSAKSGSGVAYLKLADMELESKNECDLKSAFNRYMKSYELMLKDVRARSCENSDSAYDKPIDDASIQLNQIEMQSFGLVMFRLAKCFEMALGCHRDLTIAAKLYEYSKMNLEQVFNNGCWHNKRDYIEACKGLERCRQEKNLAALL